jgi:RNA polymerase sigma factor (sigma-70 family)
MPGRSSGGDTPKHLDALFQEGTFSGLTDGELMRRCTSAVDDSAAAAFTVLVGRHGPMVLRVCYQVLGDSHDAQDAFQATVLVLARKARSVRNYDSVASWLYGVADRVARRARAEAARRRAHERRRAELTASEFVDEVTRSETWPELHEEVALLPEKLRVPIILCYLEGLTAEAAAQRLGCPRGTVLSRLSRARERLRARLARRGVSLFAGLPLYATKSAVPDALSHATVQAAVRITAGETTAGTVPASVAALTEGVLRMTFRVRLVTVVGTVLAIRTMSIGVGAFVSQTAGGPPPVAQAGRTGETKAPALSEDDPSRTGKEQGGEIVVRAFDLSRRGDDDGFAGIAAIDPKTAEWRTIYKGLSLSPGRVSPDGRYLVYSSLGVDPDDDQVGIWVYDMKGETAPRRKFERRGQPFWINNGRQVVIGSPTGRPGSGKFETWRVNADGTSRTKLPIPETDLVLDCSSNGTWLVTRTLSDKSTHRGQLGRFLEIVDSAPNDPAAIDALIWIITFGFDGPEFSRAIDRLAQNHSKRLKVAQAALTLGRSISASSEKLLRAVVEKSPYLPFRGWHAWLWADTSNISPSRFEVSERTPRSPCSASMATRTRTNSESG